MNEWNDIAVLTPPGDIDIASVPALRRRLDNLIDRGVRRVVINCQAVGFIDSVGELPRWSKSVEVQRGIENLPYYRHRVAELLESLPLRRDERYDVALALGEALGNAYDHAGGVGCILTVQAYGDRVVLEVLDRGAGYSIDGASEPVASEERGRGIKLMRMLVDNVEVARRTDGAGTRVRMVKLFSSALESCA